MKNKKFIKSTAVILAAVSLSATSGTVIFSESSIDNVQAASVDSFKDVQDKNKFFYNPVYWASSNRITTGFNDNTFRPDDTCTRGQAVTFLWRYENEPKPDTVRYLSDTKNSSFKDSISWALSTGVTTGFDDGTFRQDNPVTRGQIVTFMWRDAGSPDVKSSNSFSDVSESSAFAKAINWAAKYGITTGFEDNTFRQDQYCTRGQIVTFLYRWSALKGDDISTNAHPEDEVFIRYLQKLYKDANYYLQGCPAYIYYYNEATREEGIYSYSKFAITDFDNDGRDELLLCTYYEAYGTFEMYDVNDVGEVIMNPYRGTNNYKLDPIELKFLNNGVIIQKQNSLAGHFAHDDEYIPFNNDIRSSLYWVKKWGDQHLDLYNFIYGYGSGDNYNPIFPKEGYYIAVHSGPDSGAMPITEEEYNSDLKLLNSGTEIDVTFKDFTAQNIGL